MSERTKAITKAPETKYNSRSRKAQNSNLAQSKSVVTPVDHILYLQRTIGNQAVLKLLERSGVNNQGLGAVIQTKLIVGQPNDIYEQEADRVAEQVMRMPENTAISGQSSAIREKDKSIQMKPG